MATFRVGQRVRVNCAGARVDGSETTVRALDVWMPNYKVFGIQVNLPCFNPMFKYCIFEQHELVPLQDDGRTVVTWDACCWQPPRELETV